MSEITRKYIFWVLFLFISNATLQKSFAKDVHVNKIRVVATTTLIGTIAKEIGGNKIEVITIISGGMCPGHFDISPNIAKQIANADLFIWNGWETWAESLIRGANTDISLEKSVKMKTEGNLMVPDINLKAAQEIETILSDKDESSREYFSKNLGHYCKEVKSKAKELQKRFRKYRNKKIICSEHQKEFLEWLKMNIVAAYQRSEDLNIKVMSKIVSLAKAEKVILFVDNLQSGADTGKEIAKDLQVKHIVLTNFPEGDSYIEALEFNALQLEKGLK